MVKWEYLVLQLRGYEYEKEETLQRAGYQGWELVSREGDKCTFKRPVE